MNEDGNPLQAIVNIDEVQRLLVEQDDAMARTLMAVTAAVRNSFESDIGDDQMAELLQNYEDVLRSCDRFYDATAMVLSDHLKDIRDKRQTLTQAIANMAELNGNGEGFINAMQAGIEVAKRGHLSVVRDE